MSKKAITNKKLLSKAIVVASLILVAVLLSVLKNNTAVCEWFASNFSRWWIFLFGNIFGWLPISPYELFLFATIVYIICFLVFSIRNLCKKQLKRALSMTLTLAIFVSATVAVYTATASMSYNRDYIALDFFEYDRDHFETSLSQAEAEQLIALVISNLNTLMDAVDRDVEGNVKLPYSITELGKVIGQDYDRVLKTNTYFSPFNVSVKPIFNKWIMSQMGIYGVFFAPTGVATVNPYTPTYHMPVTVAHEMAHGKGVMYESDANLLAYYICLQSSDDFVRYSGYAAIYYQALSILDAYDNTSQLYDYYYNLINPVLNQERWRGYEFWGQFTLFDDIGSTLNDWYLKLQGQPNGTGSYNDGGQQDIDILPNPDNPDGPPIVKVVYLSQIQRMLIQMFRDGKLDLIV